MRQEGERSTLSAQDLCRKELEWEVVRSPGACLPFLHAGACAPFPSLLKGNDRVWGRGSAGWA